MKKNIKITERALSRLIDSVTKEQKVVKEFKVKDLKKNIEEQTKDVVFESMGVIGSDGYLYLIAESWDVDKIGPINGVPYVGDVFVRITEKPTGDLYEVSSKVGDGKLGVLKMKPGYTSVPVTMCDIPPTKNSTQYDSYKKKYCKDR